MNDCRAEHYFGTISFILGQIAQGMKEHDYCVMPRFSYEGWYKFETFAGESFHGEVKQHKFYEMHFVEDGHDWRVYFTKCKSPDRQLSGEFAFLDQIIKDGEELAHSKISIDEYEQYLA